MSDALRLPASEPPAPSLSARAEAVVQHALATFGNHDKAWHWLTRANPLLDGETPLHLLQSAPDRCELVDDELTRIEHGVFA